MGIETALIAASLTLGVASTVQARNQAKDARRDQQKARGAQEAANAAEAAKERRQQVREERIRRARVLQSAENTGVSESSGEFGALSSLSTQAGSNVGYNLGALSRASEISRYSQNAANAIGRSQESAALGSFLINNAGTIGAVGGKLSTSIFKPSDPMGDFLKQKNLV